MGLTYPFGWTGSRGAIEVAGFTVDLIHFGLQRIYSTSRSKLSRAGREDAVSILLCLNDDTEDSFTVTCSDHTLPAHEKVDSHVERGGYY